MSRSVRGGWRVIVPVGVAQTIAWASSYYLPAILADPVARELGMPPPTLFAALSGALVIAGLLGPRVGHVIDRIGGRGVLVASNIILAAGLSVLSATHGIVALSSAWLLLGIGMALGLYEPAFAALTYLYGTVARRPITGITLIAGFASTVGWPLSAFLEGNYGWRTTCLVWAGVHLALGLPLNLLIPSGRAMVMSHDAGHPRPEGKTLGESWMMICLGFVFAATGFVSVGLSALLPTILVQLGATSTTAITASSLVGPAQVGARLVEASWLTRFHPLVSARIATILHPLGAVVLVAGGPIFSWAFSVLYGAGNGILTITRGTLPLAIFGPVGYGRRIGLLAAPARITGAAAPLLLSILVEWLGPGALWVTGLLSLAALGGLFLLSSRRAKNE